MEFHSNQIETFCPHCKELQTCSIEKNPGEILCTHCQKVLLPNCTEDFIQNEVLNQCAACGCAHLFRQRDFNRILGVLILIVGVVFSFFTYGLSLLVVTVIDLLLYYKVKEVAVCYACSAVYRCFRGISKLEPFQLILHDHYRIVSD